MGLSFQLSCNQTLMLETHLGYQDYMRLRKPNSKTTYRMASVSKMVTAISILKLAQDGQLALDTGINEILPFEVTNPWFSTPITVRHLLSHQSSLTEGPFYDGYLADTYRATSGAELPGIEEMLAFDGQYYSTDNFLRREPGTFFSYCNVCFMLLGNIVEVVSGTRLDVFVEHQVLRGLGVTGSFNLYSLAASDIAVLYRFDAGQAQWLPTKDSYPGGVLPPFEFAGYRLGQHAAFFSPQGGLRVTVGDLGKLMQNYLQASASFALDQQSIALQTASAFRANSTNNDHALSSFQQYGLGMYLDDGLKAGQWVVPHFPARGHMGDAYGLKSAAFAVGDSCQFSYATNGARNGYGSYVGVFTEFERVLFDAIGRALGKLTF